MDDETEFFRGSGNVFADVGLPNPEARKIKAQLAIQIIKRQDSLKLTARAAAKMAGCDASDIQRIRNADWSRFSIDRLLKYAIKRKF